MSLKEAFHNEEEYKKEKLIDPSQHKTYLDHNKQPSLSRTEVFMTGDQDFRQKNRSTSNIRPKRGYHTTQNEIKEQNVENKRNIAHAESKIRAQILNDKIIHKAMKEKQQMKFTNNNQIQYNNNDNNYFSHYGRTHQPEDQMYYYKKSWVAQNYFENQKYLYAKYKTPTFLKESYQELPAIYQWLLLQAYKLPYIS